MKNDKPERSKETIAVQSDPSLMQEIEEGLSALKEGKASTYTLDELFKQGPENTPGDY